jgi:uncharacterized protein (DUF433 family)
VLNLRLAACQAIGLKHRCGLLDEAMRKEIAPRIVIDDAICGGRPVIAGTRMPVELVLGHLAGGMTVEQVMEEYELAREDVLAALSYAAQTIADDVVPAVP